MSYFPPTGSVVAFQSDPTKLQVTASVAGTVSATQIAGSILATTISGNVTVVSSIAGGIFPISGSVAAITTGQSGTVVTSVVGSVSVIGTVSVVGTLQVVSSLAGGIFPISGSVAAVVTNNVTVVSSLAGGIFPISGSVAAVITNSPTVIVNNGSVVAFQGTSPFVVNFQNSSIIAVNAGSVVALSQGSVISIQQGSVAAFQGGTWKPSTLNLITRNDTVASFLGANLVERPMMGDSAGRTVIKPFASEDSTIISYQGSIVSGSVQLIQASVIGQKSYITDFWLSNTGSVATLVTFQGGDTSVLGKFIAPSGGGMVATGINIPLKTNTSQDLAFSVTPSSSVLYLTIKGYQAQ